MAYRSSLSNTRTFSQFGLLSGMKCFTCRSES